MKIFTLIFLLFFSIYLINPKTFAAIDFKSESIIDWPATSPKGLVIIAPAKKYLMKERLFTKLAKNLNDAGFITVRFNWAPSTLEFPELELKRAAVNIYKITKLAQEKFNMNAKQTVLISKSFSSKALGESIQLASSHILLTPNCLTAEPFDTEEVYS